MIRRNTVDHYNKVSCLQTRSETGLGYVVKWIDRTRVPQSPAARTQIHAALPETHRVFQEPMKQILPVSVALSENVRSFAREACRKQSLGVKSKL